MHISDKVSNNPMPEVKNINQILLKMSFKLSWQANHDWPGGNKMQSF